MRSFRFRFGFDGFHQPHGGEYDQDKAPAEHHDIGDGERDLPRGGHGGLARPLHGVGGGHRVDHVFRRALDAGHHGGVFRPVHGGAVHLRVGVQQPVVFVGVEPQVGARRQAGDDVLVEHGGHGGLVGDDRALKAPLVPQHVGHQTLVGPGPGGPQPVHGGHGRIGIALGDGVLEALQEHLPDGLLVGEHGHAVAVGLLVVEGEVLHVGDDALLPGAPHLGGADLAGEEAVLGVVLEVPPAVGGAVDVHAGGVPARHPRVDGVLAHTETQAVDQLGVPGAGHHHLHRVGHGALATHQGAGDAGGAVLVLGGGQADAVHLDGGVAAQPHQPHSLFGGEGFRQFLPRGVAVVRPGEVGRLVPCLGLKGGHGLRPGAHHIHAPLPLQILQQGAGGLP